MKTMEQTLDSREVAEMVEKAHSDLLKDIRRYIEQFIEGNIPFNEFFKESTYIDGIGRTLPCYRVTKKGCEFIAHKLTGTKGTIFTARYINRFHEMEDTIRKDTVKRAETVKQPRICGVSKMPRLQEDESRMFRQICAIVYRYMEKRGAI